MVLRQFCLKLMNFNSKSTMKKQQEKFSPLFTLFHPFEEEIRDF
jgi:hypothetical protein